MGLKKPLVNSGIDTSDATATVNDIVSGKTAYAGGGKVTGNYVPPTVQSLTADANAIAGDIVSGKTAYVNGVKVTGTKEDYWKLTGEVRPNISESTITIPNVTFTPSDVEINCISPLTTTLIGRYYIKYNSFISKWLISCHTFSSQQEQGCSFQTANGFLSTNTSYGISLSNNNLVLHFYNEFSRDNLYEYKIG